MARTVDPQRAAERRGAIVRAAERLFAAQGYERTSVAQVAQAAGLTSGSVFYYYRDKAALFRAIFEQSIPEHTELMARHVDRIDCLAAILDIVEAMAADALDPGASGLLVELLRRIDQDEELTAVLAEDTRLTTGALTTLLRRGIAQGEFDPGFPPEETARWIVSVIDAAFLNADPERPQDPRPLVRATVSRLLQPTRTEHR
ncbi:TetR/AcrR family transcriptional regulator [Nocardia transvalensis]|uniref:TetR/AcrR family transcriptional regulator n=1 Tax=Nocardia transvalensis TaxID=37333 RepID=UPI0018954EB8|nr:TetR family transcriptional regulator [Nocardia transvalensis]MBF6331659.1 TetR/AcrR family transcriptional regulator [Nocardia transvalensis]